MGGDSDNPSAIGQQQQLPLSLTTAKAESVAVVEANSNNKHKVKDSNKIDNINDIAAEKEKYQTWWEWLNLIDAESTDDGYQIQQTLEGPKTETQSTSEHLLLQQHQQSQQQSKSSNQSQSQTSTSASNQGSQNVSSLLSSQCWQAQGSLGYGDQVNRQGTLTSGSISAVAINDGWSPIPSDSQTILDYGGNGKSYNLQSDQVLSPNNVNNHWNEKSYSYDIKESMIFQSLFSGQDHDHDDQSQSPTHHTQVQGQQNITNDNITQTVFSPPPGLENELGFPRFPLQYEDFLTSDHNCASKYNWHSWFDNLNFSDTSSMQQQQQLQCSQINGDVLANQTQRQKSTDSNECEQTPIENQDLEEKSVSVDIGPPPGLNFDTAQSPTQTQQNQYKDKRDPIIKHKKFISQDSKAAHDVQQALPQQQLHAQLQACDQFQKQETNCTTWQLSNPTPTNANTQTTVNCSSNQGQQYQSQQQSYQQAQPQYQNQLQQPQPQPFINIMFCCSQNLMVIGKHIERMQMDGRHLSLKLFKTWLDIILSDHLSFEAAAKVGDYLLHHPSCSHIQPNSHFFSIYALVFTRDPSLEGYEKVNQMVQRIKPQNAHTLASLIRCQGAMNDCLSVVRVLKQFREAIGCWTLVGNNTLGNDVHTASSSQLAQSQSQQTQASTQQCQISSGKCSWNDLKYKFTVYQAASDVCKGAKSGAEWLGLVQKWIQDDRVEGVDGGRKPPPAEGMPKIYLHDYDFNCQKLKLNVSHSKDGQAQDSKEQWFQSNIKKKLQVSKGKLDLIFNIVDTRSSIDRQSGTTNPQQYQDQQAQQYQTSLLGAQNQMQMLNLSDHVNHQTNTKGKGGCTINKGGKGQALSSMTQYQQSQNYQLQQQTATPTNNSANGQKQLINESLNFTVSLGSSCQGNGKGENLNHTTTTMTTSATNPNLYNQNLNQQQQQYLAPQLDNKTAHANQTGTAIIGGAQAQTQIQPVSNSILEQQQQYIQQQQQQMQILRYQSELGDPSTNSSASLHSHQQYLQVQNQNADGLRSQQYQQQYSVVQQQQLAQKQQLMFQQQQTPQKGKGGINAGNMAVSNSNLSQSKQSNQNQKGKRKGQKSNVITNTNTSTTSTSTAGMGKGKSKGKASNQKGSSSPQKTKSKQTQSKISSSSKSTNSISNQTPREVEVDSISATKTGSSDGSGKDAVSHGIVSVSLQLLSFGLLNRFRIPFHFYNVVVVNKFK